MSTQRLSKRTVDALLPGSKVYVVYDCDLAGFGVRITPKGARSWVVEYRPHGGGRAIGKKRLTLGSVKQLTPEQARKAATEVLANVRLGFDVQLDRAARRSSPTVRELATEFMQEEIQPTRKPRTAALYEMYFRLHIIPALGSKRAQEVTAQDLSKLHRKIGARAPVTANRILNLFSGLFSWAMKMDKLPQRPNPTSGITRFK